MSRKICVVTGSRAEYGLLRWLMQSIRQTVGLELQIIATGMHLSEEHGLTFREIEADGFTLDWQVDMPLRSDTAPGVAESMGIGLNGCGKAFAALQPDLLVVLGDRFEILSAVAAALVAKIPVAHLHGGETTEGAFDEAIRHSVTKMSHLHFVAAEPYRMRVIQLGESPDRVFVVGALGVDCIARLELLSRAALEESLGFSLGRKALLVTFHPETLAHASPAQQLTELLAVLATQSDTQILFTMPNADPGNRELASLLRSFAATHANARVYDSLGQLRYLSCVREVDGVIGNSSSGLIEVPSFRKGTVNIGDRQRGRLRGASVIDCEPQRASIGAALHKLYSSQFQESLATAENPYGPVGAVDKILPILQTFPLQRVLQKKFYDIPFAISGLAHA